MIDKRTLFAVFAKAVEALLNQPIAISDAVLGLVPLALVVILALVMRALRPARLIDLL